ncbi:fibrinolytic enzyme, isozyme C-like [Ruditapes philippinarum]|uniref:fibrinolytic enzyme, isozyme C-like n=1 Tax=Ruditapes philippinarum TaxID=129788 RepID=UPI00295B1A7D|nr:fibrinolytic enzyme, isozyme C-like [Ruditapes philippinarum]
MFWSYLIIQKMMLIFYVYSVFCGSIAVDASKEAGVRFLSNSLHASSKIINGVEAEKGEFPHQAALLYEGYHLCGASVIAQDWAITAAHCVEGRSTELVAIVLNLHDYQNPGTLGVDYLWFYIDEIIIHEDYNTGSGALPNDIALLRLTTNGYNISRNIIRLARGAYDYSNQICTISGWGTKVDGSAASKLKKTDVSVLSYGQCVYYWGDQNVLSQHVCVKGYDTIEGSGSCTGDSGGPLVCGDDLVGVKSWVIYGCHQDGVVTHPSVYARVSSFYNWVNAKCGNCAI